MTLQAANRAERAAITDALHDVCRWLLKADEAIPFFRVRLAAEADDCTALAQYLAGKPLFVSRSIHPHYEERSIASITVGGERFSVTQSRWDVDGVPVVWPWKEKEWPLAAADECEDDETNP